MPMTIPGNKHVVIQGVTTDGPLVFTDPAPHAEIVGCLIKVRRPMVPIVDFTGGRLP